MAPSTCNRFLPGLDAVGGSHARRADFLCFFAVDEGGGRW